MTDTLDIADVVHKGVSFRWKNKTTAQLEMEAILSQDVNAFLDALQESGVSYLLVGGIALLQYIDARNTEDIDLILSLPDVEKIAGVKWHDTNELFSRGRYRMLTVGMLRAENPFFSFIQLTESLEAAFLGRTLRTATARGLALLKLYALPSMYRQHNHARVSIYESDIRSLVFAAELDTAALLETLIPFMPASDIKELGSILADFTKYQNRFS